MENKDENIIDIPYSVISCYKGLLSVIAFSIIIVMLGYNTATANFVYNPIVLIGAGMASLAMFISVFRIVLKVCFTKRNIKELDVISLNVSDDIFKSSTYIILAADGFVEFKQGHIENFLNIGNIVIQDISGRLIFISEVSDFSQVMSRLVNHPASR